MKTRTKIFGTAAAIIASGSIAATTVPINAEFTGVVTREFSPVVFVSAQDSFLTHAFLNPLVEPTEDGVRPEYTIGDKVTVNYSGTAWEHFKGALVPYIQVFENGANGRPVNGYEGASDYPFPSMVVNSAEELEV